MRLVGFGGAMRLDGYIAGPTAEYDWITVDPISILRNTWRSSTRS
jgi:hypothetical protein